ncbi:MAG TPA: radical SAM protein [Bryobacteraceae bacterium]|nr:radical SAM protein [Bryobacteraceae bacterium]
MADILLSHCNHLFYDRKQVRKMQPYPPLQTLLAAAVLRRQGFDVALFDSTLESPEEGFRQAIEKHRPRLVALCEDNFNFLTKMCLTRNRELAFFMAAEAGARGVPVTVNSSDATDHVREYLDAGVNYVVVGEVEQTLAELAGALLGDSGTLAEQVAGLAFRDPDSGMVRRTGPRALLTNLDHLPFAAWDLIEVSRYRAAWIEAHGYFALNMVSGRGCPYRCNWCAKPIYGQSYHVRSPRRVAEEMRSIKTAFSPDRIWFADDIFALSARWTREFADAVEQLDARIPFQMQSRCDLMTRGTVSALRRAGCAEVWMGAESGSQQVLNAMDKEIRVTDIYQACDNLRAHEIRACLFLQFGYPGETWEDIEQTIRMVREIRPHDIGVSVAYPLPGTRFYAAVESQLGAKKNWADSDDLAMMFRGTYESRFYRALRDALHLELTLRDNGSASGRAGIDRLWRRVEQMRDTCVTNNPTVLWTCS